MTSSRLVSSKCRLLALSQGLQPIGHALNPSKAIDPGYFGDPRCGVNLSPFVDYVLKSVVLLPAVLAAALVGSATVVVPSVVVLP